jgi:starch synthase (maltosyl-transferring)
MTDPLVSVATIKNLPFEPSRKTHSPDDEDGMAQDRDAGRRRVAIEGIKPVADCGRWPIKRILGERIVVEADVFGDGHDEVRCLLLYRHEQDEQWTTVPLAPLGNDRWRAEFTVDRLGVYRYTICGWIDHFSTWRHDLEKRVAAGTDVRVDLLIGAKLVAEAAVRADRADAAKLNEAAAAIGDNRDPAQRVRSALDPALLALVEKYPDLRLAVTYDHDLRINVDRPRAQFSAWYEMFPRSASPEAGRHGTFADCQARLPYIAEMGFNVLYFPPIHPIGMAFRKGKNNAPTAGADEVGSPWGIGSPAGGHKAILSDLGTLEDFRRLIAAAAPLGIEIALDIAFQCSPDHPCAAEHPEWFRRRPDGTIQYAENPPKKYQDIYPFDFETSAWRALWEELKSVVLFWIVEGVRIFRVDNPHTKPFAFWEWLIEDVRRRHPDVLFLSEAFTRPKIMYRLAKLGFTQSYTYFTWRNSKQELTEYLTEITRPEIRDFFRPNFWPNTPDILPEFLQTGGRPAFVARVVLAATLAANFGIYGPGFELIENTPREPHSEEYLNSEKYELRHWDLDRPGSLSNYIGRLNRIRAENPALQSDANLAFHAADNDQIICYSKRTGDRSNVIVVAVNLDPQRTQSALVDLPLAELGIPPDQPFQMHDLLTDKRYTWRGARGFVELAPNVHQAHVFRLRRWVRRENDIECYE